MANDRLKLQDEAGQAIQTAAQPDSKPAQPAKARERKFLVLETAQIPRGGSHFTLPKGKVISSQGYDIEGLKRQGVKLEEAAA